MARAAKAAKVTKRKAPRRQRRGSEWDMVPVDKGWHAAQYHIHYMIESKSWETKVREYIKKHYDKKTVAAINKLPAWKVGGKSHYATAAVFEEQRPDLIHESYVGRLDAWIKSLAEEGAKIVEEKKAEEKAKSKRYVPTIQERLEEAAEIKYENIEGWLDDFIRDPKKNPLKGHNILGELKKQGVNLGHVRFYKKWYAGPQDEIEELMTLPTASKRNEMQKQLAEGYSTYTKAQLKDLQMFYQRLFQAFDILQAENKHNRIVRKPKKKSAAELTKKMKYKISDPDFGIASVKPEEIVGANMLVVFNCKTRKLGIYYPEDHAQFSVKGTTLQFFDEKRSTQKTVRKPLEVLPEYKKAPKTRCMKLYESLKTTDTKMNGRFNDETVILRVFK